MLHLIQLLEFLVGLVGTLPRVICWWCSYVSCIGPQLRRGIFRVANLKYSTLNRRMSPVWWVLCTNSQGAFAVFVIIVSHCMLHGLARPSFLIVILHVLALFLAIATFVYCFLEFPYNGCRNSSSKGCQVDKVAVPMDGVLMYCPFLWLMLMVLGACFLFPPWFSLTISFSGTRKEGRGIRDGIIEFHLLSQHAWFVRIRI